MLSIRPRIINHVGVAFTVKPPKWSDEEPTRGTMAPLAVALTDANTISILLNGKAVLDLNGVDAETLGVALIRAGVR
jgi:hypothetical protein